jgi:diguanylate cyclase (GGDEF)-like protein
MEALVEASLAIASSEDVQNVLEDVSRYATRTIGCHRAEVYVFDEQHKRVVASATSGINAAERAILQRLVDLPVGVLPAERAVLATRQPVIQRIDDPDIPADVRSWLRSIGKIQTLMVPLIAHGEVIGILDFWTPGTQHQFDPDDVSAARAIGQEAGLAIDNLRLMSMLRERADQDGLTSLLNHRAVLAALDHELMLARRTDKPLTVIMIDLNDFKTVNDRFGHLAGDRVLVKVAQDLRACVRDCDHIGRYGGDEFLLVLPGCDADEAEAIAARLAECVRSQMFQLEDVEITINVSIGTAHFPRDGSSRPELILLADASMYAVKAAQAIKE